MIFPALIFVFGAFCLQQLPALPDPLWALVCIPLLLICISAMRVDQYGFSLLSRSPSFLSRPLSLLNRPALVLLSFFLGFFWAAAVAAIRLGDTLPAAWENKPIQIVGVVASVSELHERGERFRFDVENVLTQAAVVPRHISLSYYQPRVAGEVSAYPGINAAKFHAGERWQFTVRLKRPHGVQNPHGFDFEAWALSENIRATGSIKAKADNKKLQDFVWRPGYLVEHVREIIRQRIARVLAGKPYSGIEQALVMGDVAGLMPMTGSCSCVRAPAI